MSRDWSTWARAWRRFPRVSGDEPAKEQNELAAEAFSPRERG